MDGKGCTTIGKENRGEERNRGRGSLFRFRNTRMVTSNEQRLSPFSRFPPKSLLPFQETQLSKKDFYATRKLISGFLEKSRNGGKWRKRRERANKNGSLKGRKEGRKEDFNPLSSQDVNNRVEHR